MCIIIIEIYYRLRLKIIMIYSYKWIRWNGQWQHTYMERIRRCRRADETISLPGIDQRSQSRLKVAMKTKSTAIYRYVIYLCSLLIA